MSGGPERDPEKTPVLVNLTRGRVLARRLAYAETFWKRLVGLMGRRALGPEEALIIVPCPSIHTFFMRFPIDVAFLDREWRVLRIVHALAPFRWSGVVSHAHYAVELPAYRLRNSGCQEGDVLRVTGSITSGMV